ncbi:MAG: L-aspartate oxidase [Thermoanaerobaculia bacterium]
MNAVDVHALASETVASDVVVVGSGIAGLSAALGLSSGRRSDAGGRRGSGHPGSVRTVALLTKTDLGGGSSEWAQGGVAAAVGDGDSPRLHARDTLAAGAGIGDAAVVEILTREGPERIRRLIDLGGRFDRGTDGELALGREGAHGRRRILHADGDATGREMVRALRGAVRLGGRVEVHEKTFVRDLVLSGDRVVGVLARRPGGGLVFHRAAAVILATGGFGQLYARTTNPVEATGDGLAIAARAGAVLADLELVQFHPTALDVDGDPLPLVTEALRGEGALLVDDRGERFMPAIDARAELAPRDIVARAIHAHQLAGRRVFLDARSAVGEAFPRRFPTVWEHCRRHRIDPRRQLIPVTPAAHYTMAGVAVDAAGGTSLPGLWACGEVTSTGVHGANRLASNSLLEALVFGARVADDVAASLVPSPALRPARPEVVWRQAEDAVEPGAVHDPADLRRRSRSLMWEKVALVRDRAGLEQALAELGRMSMAVPPAVTVAELETRNLMLLGRLVTAAALAREETRGAHCRSDFPLPDPRFERRLFWHRSSVGDDFPLTAVPRFPQAAPAREIA